MLGTGVPVTLLLIYSVLYPDTTDKKLAKAKQMCLHLMTKKIGPAFDQLCERKKLELKWKDHVQPHLDEGGELQQLLQTSTVQISTLKICTLQISILQMSNFRLLQISTLQTYPQSKFTIIQGASATICRN